MSKKKKTTDQKAKESIMNLYHTLGKEPWLVAKVATPGVLCGAFHSDGVSIYKFDKIQPILTESHEWKNFTEASVDFFSMRTVIVLKGEGHGTTLIMQEKGKELVSLLRSSTSIVVQVIDRPWWRKILGFRSNTKWKMVIAVAVYLLLISRIVGAMNDTSVPASTASNSSVSTPAKTSEQKAQEKADAELKAKQEAEAKAAAEKVAADAKAAKAAQALVTLKSEAKTIPYKDLARNPDQYTLASVKYTGKVIQVQEDGNNVGLRVNVTKNTYGYENTMFVAYDKSIVKGRVLDDDIISFWGNSTGLLTYKTVLGAEMSIPQVLARIVEVN